MIFGSKKDNYYLGVDFGTRSIKAVELEYKKGKAHLVNYAWVALDDARDALDSFDGDYAVLLQEALKSLIYKMKPRANKANVAIPAFNGLVMTVDFPKMSEEDLGQAIEFESRKYIPTSLDDVNVSWEIIDPEKSEEKMEVLLVAAPKSEVQYYDSLFKGTGVSVDALELETFALARTLLGEKDGRYILVDIGAKTTNIVLIEGGFVRVNRNIDVGGIDLTNTISDRMNISKERARSIKESSKNLFSGPMAVSFPSIGYLTNEIERIRKAQKSDVLDGIVLSGGTASMTGFAENIEAITKTTTTIVEPLESVVVDEKDAAIIEKKLGTSYSVVIGLALQALQQHHKK